MLLRGEIKMVNNDQIILENMVALGNGCFILSDAISALVELKDSYEGKFSMIYIDPPGIGGASNSIACKVCGKQRSFEAFRDISLAEYKSMLKAVLTACHPLLCESGCVFLHTTQMQTHHARLILDEVFGADCFLNEIIWTYKAGGRSSKRFSSRHDSILFYAKAPLSHYFNSEAIGIKRGSQPHNHRKRGISEDGRVYFTALANGRAYRYYEDSTIVPSDVWDDIDAVGAKSAESTGYPQQKPSALIKRMLLCSTKKDDLVLDLFSGSGTLAALASDLDRRWIAIDNSPAALMTIRNRLLQRSSGMLQDAGSVTLKYNAPMEPFEMPHIEVTYSEDMISVIIERTSLDIPLRYAALCDLAPDNTLTPLCSSLCSTMPIRLPFVKIPEHPVVQVVYADFSQALIPLK